MHKISILGVFYDVVFHNYNKQPNYMKKDNIVGCVGYLKNKIEVIKWENGGKINWRMVERFLWHEIGHAVNQELANCVEGEELASAFEYIPTLTKQVKNIIKKEKEGGK